VSVCALLSLEYVCEYRRARAEPKIIKGLVSYQLHAGGNWTNAANCRSRCKYVKEGVEHCLTVQFEIDGHKRIFFTGSNVLKDQLEKYACEIPFLATLKKIDRYFTFS